MTTCSLVDLELTDKDKDTNGCTLKQERAPVLDIVSAGSSKEIPE